MQEEDRLQSIKKEKDQRIEEKQWDEWDPLANPQGQVREQTDTQTDKQRQAYREKRQRELVRFFTCMVHERKYKRWCMLVCLCVPCAFNLSLA